MKSITQIKCMIGVVLAGFFAYAVLHALVLPRGQKTVVEDPSVSVATFSQEETSAVPSGSAADGSKTAGESETADGSKAADESETADGSKTAENTSASETSGEESGTSESGTAEAPTAVTEKPDEPVVTANSYVDENIEVHISIDTINYSKAYIADVRIRDLSYLKTGFARDTFGMHIVETASKQAKKKNAIIAINGDYFGAREQGVVIRNGSLYRNTVSNRDDLAILTDGSFFFFNELQEPADSVFRKGVWQSFCFGPVLLEQGKLRVTAGDDIDHMTPTRANRTAIGEYGPGHYVFMVIDGRLPDSPGVIPYDMALYLQKLGVKNAYNLDGGGSSSLVFMGKVLNRPTLNGSVIEEREISDIVYIGY